MTMQLSFDEPTAAPLPTKERRKPVLQTHACGPDCVLARPVSHPCPGCGADLARVMSRSAKVSPRKWEPYCARCADIVEGKRYENGKKREEVEGNNPANPF